ncbi:hypothetical protein [Streptomyces sp. NPDC026589]|uniref:hypothetical protein n=1 Tax=Streptomyces sp. NPDC026589 TaxID=3155609 RepID=UPI0033D4A966
MTQNSMEKARAAKAAADAKLAELEAAEAHRAAEAEAVKQAERKRQAERFLTDLPELEQRIKGETVTSKRKAEALEAGTLGVLVANFLARRDALQMLRNYAQGCRRLLNQDPYVGIAEVRHVDPGDELRRWNEAAMAYLRDRDAQALAGEALDAYRVD